MQFSWQSTNDNPQHYDATTIIFYYCIITIIFIIIIGESIAKKLDDALSTANPTGTLTVMAKINVFI